MGTASACSDRCHRCHRPGTILLDRRNSETCNEKEKPPSHGYLEYLSIKMVPPGGGEHCSGDTIALYCRETTALAQCVVCAATEELDVHPTTPRALGTPHVGVIPFCMEQSLQMVLDNTHRKICIRCCKQQAYG